MRIAEIVAAGYAEAEVAKKGLTDIFEVLYDEPRTDEQTMPRFHALGAVAYVVGALRRFSDNEGACRFGSGVLLILSDPDRGSLAAHHCMLINAGAVPLLVNIASNRPAIGAARLSLSFLGFTESGLPR